LDRVVIAVPGGMTGRKGREQLNYSYERVSTTHQDERRQEVALGHINIDTRFVDKCSGKDADRPMLKKLFKTVKRGDHVYCESISRFGRNVDDLRRLTAELVEKGVTVHFVKEGFNTAGDMYKFLLTILGAVAEMEREQIRARTIEGLEKARKYGTRSGKPIGRPKPEIPKEFYRYYEKWKEGDITMVEFARLLGKGRATVYRWIKNYV